MRDSTVKWLSSLHRVLYRMTSGLLGRRLVDNDILILTTRGRSTGREHTVPLLYLRDGDRLVVIASYGGRDRHPEWYLNLVAEPLVTVQIGGELRAYRARTATEEEWETWWPHVVSAYSDYAVYQSRTDRQIPVIMLEPAGPT
ncbi:MAG TPA: nitroreductase family deazaflavin-dependent oxidoreductase [Acidimicrobiia bacterium]|nr:nitroreductase family deazaflavin-dependent oxidoreductase [Acidimicrobiia bacterium]